MELLYDLVLPPIIGFLLAKIIARLPAKIQLFLASCLLASIGAPSAWILFISIFKPTFADAVGQTAIGIQVLFVVILVTAFFGINHFQVRRKQQLIQAQFRLATDLIRGYQFQRALGILATINDPLAREWEAVLNDMIRHDPEFLQHLESIEMT
jgi:hypothetical protein